MHLSAVVENDSRYLKMDKAQNDMLESLVAFNKDINDLQYSQYTGKQNLAEQKAMISGLHCQIEVLGHIVQQVVNQMKKNWVFYCNNSQKAAVQAKGLTNYIDDLCQGSLIGKISLNIQEPKLKKVAGIKDTVDYNELNANVLLVAARYGVDITPQDSMGINKIYRSGAIGISFYGMKPESN